VKAGNTDGRDGVRLGRGRQLAAGFAPAGLLHEAWHLKPDEFSGETDKLRTFGRAVGRGQDSPRNAAVRGPSANESYLVG
jgi:hypothetical protein